MASRLPPVPILGVTGVNGAGKTLLAVELSIDRMRAGIPVYSSVPIDAGDVQSRPLVSLTQLLTLRDCVVLLDEIATVFSSRSSSSVPSEVVTFLQTLRHRGEQGVSVIWTAPSWKRADILVRECTQAVATVRPILRRSTPDSLWPRPLVAGVGVLDCTDVGTDEAPSRVLRRRLWIPQRSVAWGAYDTHADTPQIGRLLASGPCPDCGGTRSREKCTPELHERLGLDAPLSALDAALLGRAPAALSGHESAPAGVPME